MSNLQFEIIKLVEENYSTIEIQKKLNISHKQLQNQLRLIKENGFEFDNIYDNKGNIKLNFKTRYEKENNNKINIINSDKSIHLVASSDNHLGAVEQDINNSYMMYDYCSKNGINVILNSGDFLSGKKPWWPNAKIGLLSQIERAIEDYPYDENIITFMIFGNHDLAFLKDGISIPSILEKKRMDIIPLDYNRDYISVNQELISLIHDPKYIKKLTSRKLVLHGHYHKFKIDKNENELIISVPSISNLSTENEIPSPGFLDISINFKDGYYEDILVKHILCKDNTELENEYYFKYTEKESPVKKLGTKPNKEKN